ncbi:MAG: branched-chain amino acid--2-keto-4-methylthiobutyrate aminotransferase [Robiginitomaculum sp.]|nr:MAG: branched-chain amino acid--2-keto-4-methylthiobutyrate aminotransferase [Robiginitomaculum sp.]
MNNIDVKKLPGPMTNPQPVDEAYASGAAYIIDKFVPLSEAAVPITDRGFLRGDATYDVVSVWGDMFFRLDDHLARFEAGCAKIKISCPFSRQEIIAILKELIHRAGLSEAYVWFGCTRGDVPKTAGAQNNPASYQNRFYAWVSPYVWIAGDEQRSRGINLYLSKSYIRIPPNAIDPTVKNLNGLDFTMALFEAGENGAEWVVVTDNDGFVIEGAGANLFIVKNGQVLTPIAGVLEGITRQTTMDICAQLNVSCTRTKIHKSEFMQADEIFITSTAGGIMPCGTLDGKPIGPVGEPGDISMRVYQKYWEKRKQGWLGTPVKEA